MKKLMIIAAIALTAALTQAATVSWGMNGLKDSDGNALSSGAAYIFTTKGPNATTVDAVTAALAALTSPDAVKAYLQDNSLSALKSSISGGSAGVSGVDLATSGVPAATTGVKLFAVIVDDDTFGTDTHYVVTAASSNVKTPAATTSNNAGFTIDGVTATSSAANWKPASPVPEPTSGILMLVGLGALALRRRRA